MRFWVTPRNLAVCADTGWIYGGFHHFNNCPCFTTSLGAPVEVHAVYEHHDQHHNTRVLVGGKRAGHVCQLCHSRRAKLEH